MRGTSIMMCNYLLSSDVVSTAVKAAAGEGHRTAEKHVPKVMCVVLLGV